MDPPISQMSVLFPLVLFPGTGKHLHRGLGPPLRPFPSASHHDCEAGDLCQPDGAHVQWEAIYPGLLLTTEKGTVWDTGEVVGVGHW